MKLFQTIILILLTTTLFAQSTTWNEYKLKEHWKTNGADEIEGIYVQMSPSFYTKYSLALIKTSTGYNLLYITGENNSENIWRWKVGDIKAQLTPTATQYLLKSLYFKGNKEITTNSYVIFEQGVMCVFWDDVEDKYLKLFPTYNNNITAKSSNTSKVASGTGFGISSNGIIATNYHVIDDAKSIKVRGVNSDFNKTYNAKVLVSDKNNDLALIQIDDYGFSSLGTIPYTIKTRLAEVGENIFVLGYPLRTTMGDEIKLTNGIISSRTGFQGDISSYQISAPVQPGNSGGPLFDSQGNLIGIINAKHDGAENASYAVKTSFLTNLIELLPSKPKIQTINTLTGKTLTQQVELVKKFVYIIEKE